MFAILIYALPLMHCLWWWHVHRKLRVLPHAGRWRAGLAVFGGALLVVYGWQMVTRMSGQTASIPTSLLTLTYVWYLVVLPLAAIAIPIGGGIAALRAGIRAIRRSWPAVRQADGGASERAATNQPAVKNRMEADTTIRDNRAEAGPTIAQSRVGTGEAIETNHVEIDAANRIDRLDADFPARTTTRRQVLAATAAILPPALASAGTLRALALIDEFRIRRIDVRLPTLPPPLDGMTIVNVSDTHVGRFTNGATLRKIADAANALRPDLMVLTGDLIDHRLADLPAALDMVKRLDAPGGVWMCEGNHDLFESRIEFERRVIAAGVPLLLNEAATARVRGQQIQILGASWGGMGSRSAGVETNVHAVAAEHNREAFAVLLAHHPHAFDAAADAGIPLTLAGHTHGGQLMLNEWIGVGPLMFRYWSGLYQRDEHALVVSNGVGNWFPLRLNAPAEIMHLTLRRAQPWEA